MDTGVLGLNLAEVTNVCRRLSMLCCPVYIEALRRADRPSKDSTKCRKIRSEISRRGGLGSARAVETRGKE
jgi:hypothetical protein